MTAPNLSAAMRHNLKQTCTLIMHQQQWADQSPALCTPTCSDTPTPPQLLFIRLNYPDESPLFPGEQLCLENISGHQQAHHSQNSLQADWKLKTDDVVTEGSDWRYSGTLLHHHMLAHSLVLDLQAGLWFCSANYVHVHNNTSGIVCTSARRAENFPPSTSTNTGRVKTSTVISSSWRSSSYCSSIFSHT